MPATNTLKLLALYTNPESHNARYRQSDRRTTGLRQ